MSFWFDHFLERYLIKLALIVCLEDITIENNLKISKLTTMLQENINKFKLDGSFEVDAEKYIGDVVYHTNAIETYKGKNVLEMNWEKDVLPKFKEIDQSLVKIKFPKPPVIQT